MLCRCSILVLAAAVEVTAHGQGFSQLGSPGAPQAGGSSQSAASECPTKENLAGCAASRAKGSAAVSRRVEEILTCEPLGWTRFRKRTLNLPIVLTSAGRA